MIAVPNVRKQVYFKFFFYLEMLDKMRQAAITIYEFLREVRYEVYMSILAFALKNSLNIVENWDNLC